MADILLVDDSKIMRLLVQRALRQSGYRSLTVEEADNGLQALEKLAAGQPRLILSDWNMPEMTGIEFLRRVRSENCRVPFGFITSECSKEIREIATDAGATFLVTKPFSAEDIETALTPILGGA